VVSKERWARAFRVHGSGSFHRPMIDIAEAVAPSRTPGVARATAAPGVDLCLDGESVVHVPWGIAPMSASTGPTTHDG
jgi:hypothetical protein